ncbi:MAG: hypothetical protein M0Q51_11390 [Bacteroidales bacterium]|nr:hypothetical protein [Bacteroidales bacterium]
MELINRKVFFLIKEYEKLKDEQNKRIEFRDHMIYITLGVFGGVFAFILEKPEYNMALLIIPFVSIVLGWTYLMNDVKVSEIGLYIKKILIPKIENSNSDSTISLIPNWEDYHKLTHHRNTNKTIQLIVDILLFCFAALFSIVIFFYLSSEIKCFHIILGCFEALLIFYLTFNFITIYRFYK